MDAKEIGYLVEGVSATLTGYYGEIYESLVTKGKKRMGQQTKAEAPVISELIKRNREEQAISELLSRGEQGQNDFIQSIEAEVRKTLSSMGVVTRSDLARVQRRMDEIDKILADRGE